MRKQFCIIDKILISYLDENVCFEELDTAESILFDNTGKILFNNFNDEKTKFYEEYFNKVYPYIKMMRGLDSLEAA